MSKLYYAREYRLLDRLWVAWFYERKGVFYFINARKALKIDGELVELNGEPNPYKVIPLKYWITWRKWIEMLMIKVAEMIWNARKHIEAALGFLREEYLAIARKFNIDLEYESVLNGLHISISHLLASPQLTTNSGV